MASKKQFGRTTTALEVIEGINLKGREAIVTGGAGGIGIETVKALAKAGARVIIAARDAKRSNDVVEEIRKETGNNQVEFEELELSSLKSIKAFVDRYLAKNRSLHILINNAGVMRTPEGKTEDGFETQFGINHVGHFALTVGLLPALKAAKGARVVSLSSLAHVSGDVDLEDPNFKVKPYDAAIAYAQSKSANSLFAVGFNKRYSKDGVYANAVMPGTIISGLQRHMSDEEKKSRGFFDENGKINPNFKTVEQGAATSVWAAVSPDLEGRGGLYLEDCQIIPETTLEAIDAARASNFKDGFPRGYLARAVDPVRADKLWEITEKMIVDAAKPTVVVCSLM